MDPRGGWQVRPASWEADGSALSAVRTAVFVDEQGVAVEIERDGCDPDCQHVLASAADGTAIGAARITAEGKIGRMAVLSAWRGRGVGSALLDALLGLAGRAGLTETRLHAQAQAAEFYARFGFDIEGEAFEEAEIPHVAMVRRI